MDVLPADEIIEFTALGELALAPVLGVLPAAIHANSKNWGLICPNQQGGRAAWAGDVRILAPTNLLALINHFKGTQILSVPSPSIRDSNLKYPDLADIRGQENAKRALEIAAAGGRDMLMVGPPGSSKSMLAQHLPGLLPTLDASETLEVSMIRRLSGGLGDTGPTPHRPFRDPQHSASMPSLVGGGMRTKPGEVSLAHLGLLFLNELPKFQRAALEALRQPMETGRTTVSRANAHVTYPARFQLIAAMNPFRCGYLDDPSQACTRAPRCFSDYQTRISGPLFDRIDLHVDVPAVNPLDLSKAPISG
jgi:magnesium chelatase family protein